MDFYNCFKLSLARRSILTSYNGLTNIFFFQLNLTTSCVSTLELNARDKHIFKILDSTLLQSVIASMFSYIGCTYQLFTYFSKTNSGCAKFRFFKAAFASK